MQISLRNQSFLLLKFEIYLLSELRREVPHLRVEAIGINHHEKRDEKREDEEGKEELFRVSRLKRSS